MKSISAILAKGTFLKDGGSQEHGKDVDEHCCFLSVLASAVNKTAAMCEQASPRPAIHKQCAHITSPLCLIATHTFKGGEDSFWECFTKAVNK